MLFKNKVKIWYVKALLYKSVCLWCFQHNDLAGYLQFDKINCECQHEALVCVKDKRSVHKKLQELKPSYTINSFMLQNFLAIKKRFAKLSVTTEFKFTQMKSNSIRKWLSME